MSSIYTSFPLGLRLSHRALTRNLVRFRALDPERPHAELADYVRLFVEFLDVHHTGEDRSFFPALQRHTAGRTTDAAHLDRWIGEHREIVRLGEELSALAGQLSTDGRRQLSARSADLLAVLEPHVASEEEVLTPQHLAEMIPEAELATAVDEVARANRSRALAMASFLASSLEPAEQDQLFGGAPWVFRRVLLPLSKRRMRRFDTILHPQGAA